MEDLFSSGGDAGHEPLASRMRPRTLDEYIGQDHIVGKGRLLRRAIAADQLTSVIFYGPPGSGKTTLARVIANHTQSNFITLNAVLTGVADIRKSIQDAEQQRSYYSRKTILFVDEVHRWNKSQQDALLPWVENGTIILIGATTENPFFEVNKALVSRSRVFQLKPLTSQDLMKAANQALKDKERGYGNWNVEFEKGALEHLVDTANGDARSLLNALELAVETTPEKWDPNNYNPEPPYGSTIYISKETSEESIQKKVVLYDRDGDYHYDIISAFIKSLRGRDPDAACYWLARMVKAGEDPSFIFRRMLISACEDSGLADPNAITVVQSCAQAFDRVGMPEGNYFLAHAALYLSTCPKSNSSMAFFDALSAVEKEDADVPNHLKDPSRDAEGFGHGAGYMYPHAYRNHWVGQQYLPDTLVGRVFYNPSTQGYENSIREEVLSRREVQIATILEENGFGDVKNSNDMVNPISDWWMDMHFKSSIAKEENLTFSPVDQAKEKALSQAEYQWRKRLESNHAQMLLGLRNKLLECSTPMRHHRNFVWNADDGFIVFEVLRKSPEGFTVGSCRSDKGLEVMEMYSSNLGELDRPTFLLEGKSLIDSLKKAGQAEQDGEPFVFDRLYFRDPVSSAEEAASFTAQLKSFVQEGFTDSNALCVISQRIPKNGQRLSQILHQDKKYQFLKQEELEILKDFEKADEEFFTSTDNPLFKWDSASLEKNIEAQGFNFAKESFPIVEKRKITAKEIEKWFDPNSSAYGAWIFNHLGKEKCQFVVNSFLQLGAKQLVDWQTENFIYKVSL